ncbi:MAG: 2-phosphosulfolactate phosphatase [Candidatus Glassbacteria bacterium]|nr:2-phosphosulfolactate phosphatase [Candidatus Glassbacteria bacterium]
MPGMLIQRTSLLSGAVGARGCVVIVDVFRACTCASIILSFVPAELRLEEDPETCLRLKRDDGFLAVGELEGVTVQGFDMGNSPSRIAGAGKESFADRRVVLRTSAGVRGVFAAREQATGIWAGSYTTVSALAKALTKSSPAEVTIVAMGWSGRGRSPEDEHCAACLYSLLDQSAGYDHAAALQEIMRHESARKFLRGDKDHFPVDDVTWCLQRDLFAFAMKVEDKDGILRLVKITA